MVEVDFMLAGFSQTSGWTPSTITMAAIDLNSIEAAHVGLLGAHVDWRAEQLMEPGDERLVGQLGVGGLGNSEIDDLGDGVSVVETDQHVRRFHVAVNDPLLMRVMQGQTHINKKL
jgi:hypothetical protein